MKDYKIGYYTPICLGWRKLNPKAIIPTKDKDAAGYDVYTTEEDVIVAPHAKHLFPTGLAAVIDRGWWIKAEDRGSTGSKGLHVHCGVIDNDYRGEIFICLNNDNNYPVKFTNKEEPGIHSHKEIQQISEKSTNGIELAVFKTAEVEVIDYLVYPTSKAIAQLVAIPSPEYFTYEISDEKWEELKDTKRGEGKLGSSGK